MKTITVSGAVILRTNSETKKKEIFTTQRGYGDFKDGWEILGGKLEPDETPEQCIVREIKEELELLEHEAARWLTKEDLRSVDWLPADQLILDKIEEIL